MEKEEELKKLKQEIIDMNICKKLKSQATKLVFGEGDPNSKIVFIGEAPGKSEDLSGRPFVGAAGKLLNQMLLKANLNRDDVYITNIVKYRPPNNRDPLESEKDEFYPYLVRQIEIIKPKIIITLGRHSMNLFLPKSKISTVHGMLEQIKLPKSSLRIGILPFYHPAAALYNGGLRKTLEADFLKIPKLIKSINN